MRVHLFVNYKDIDKYERGEEIIATDLQGKSVVLNSNDEILPVSVDSRDIDGREDFISQGWVEGIFNKYLIRKG